MKINEIITEGSMDDQMSMIKRKLADKSASELSAGLPKALDNSRKSGANVTYKGGKLSRPTTQQIAPVNAQPVKTPKTHTLRKETPAVVDKKYTIPELDRMLGSLNKLKKESGDLKKYIISYAKKHDLFLDRTQISSLELPTNKEQEDAIFRATSPNQGKAYEQLFHIYNNHNNELFDFIRSKGMK